MQELEQEENMRRYAGQILNDSLRDFDATLNFNKAKDAGLKICKIFMVM
ncbi:MAG: hypothetical protein CM15mV104_220 [Caudoviricetes sp.]|nr:MAG: hypothetical protein CM15mV104_220 [Caudoviricetes sp.]